VGSKEEKIWKTIYPVIKGYSGLWTQQAQWILELGQEETFTELSETNQEERSNQIRYFLMPRRQSKWETEREEKGYKQEDFLVYEDEEIDEDEEPEDEELDEWEEDDCEEFDAPHPTIKGNRRRRPSGLLLPTRIGRPSENEDTAYREAKAFHDAAQTLIRKWKQGGIWSHPVNLHWRVAKIERGKSSAVHICSSYPNRGFYLFKGLISKILMEVKERLWLCSRKECSNLFIRHRRQTYCSPRCAGLARIRRFRKQRKEMKGQKS